MTDPYDDARDLVRRAYRAGHDQPDFDTEAGLAEVLDQGRANEWSRLTQPSVAPADLRIGDEPSEELLERTLDRLRARTGGRTTSALPKIVLTGGPGSGKSALMASVCADLVRADVRTDETRTADVADARVQAPRAIAPERAGTARAETHGTTTIAIDAGRLPLPPDMTLYLFSTPRPPRYSVWDDVIHHAIGAIVVVDTRALSEAFRAIDFLEFRGLPFIVVINRFNGVLYHRPEDVREVLALEPSVPIVACDVRDPETARRTLITLVEHALGTQHARVDA